jgi:hypothetical protein
LTATLADLRRTYQAHRSLIFDALESADQVDFALRAHALAVMTCSSSNGTSTG